MFEYVNEWLKTKYTVSKGLKRKTLLSLPCSQEVQYVHVHTKGNPSRHLKALLITSNYPKNKLNSRLFELTMYTILAWSNATDKLIQYCTGMPCRTVTCTCSWQLTHVIFIPALVSSILFIPFPPRVSLLMTKIVWH